LLDYLCVRGLRESLAPDAIAKDEVGGDDPEEESPIEGEGESTVKKSEEASVAGDEIDHGQSLLVSEFSEENPPSLLPKTPSILPES